jgi:hypothetical protein
MPEDPAIAAERKRKAAEVEAANIRKLKELERERDQARRQSERDRIEAADRIYEYEYDLAQKASQSFVDQQKDIRDGLLSLAEIGTSALDAIAIGGEKAGDVLKGMVKQLASAALQAALLGQGPLAAAFGGSSGGGFFGKLIGSFLGGGGTPVSLYHNGGIAGQSSGMSRTVNPAMFANAPRYHSGGVAGLKSGEVPAVLQKGEIILPRGKSMGGSGMNVQVNNYGNDRVNTSRTADGGLRIDIVEAVSKVIASGGADKAMRSKFGLNPGKVTR